MTGNKSSDGEQTEEPVPEIPIGSCLLTNISSCPLSEIHEDFVVTIYNPLSRPVGKYVRLPVVGTSYKVLDPQGFNLSFYDLVSNGKF